ncbi:F-box/kelch-repeat protein At3g23880-like [Impatiens glandulifera]|uniref:F-box/kelch-repeat protein At3g23880-like n=1 Tax=Impatiens glandulifera TaxID=253017 RepID=UPI001FB10B3E|nr:F-box/kelch-repeat protein At3g23880-like [Impatiens glandulifera]
MEINGFLATAVRRIRSRTIQRITTVAAADDRDFFHVALSMPEIIAEILIRLPVRSLLIFMCVSRSWRALISDPIFIKMHLRASIQNKNYAHHRLIMNLVNRRLSLKSCPISSVLHERSPVTHTLDCPLLKDLNRSCSVSIVGSVNGLICIAVNDINLFIWNPATRKSKRLPHCGVRKHPGRYSYGFGYDEASSDYKVVVIYSFISYQGSFVAEEKIYGLKSDKNCKFWRKIGNFPKGIPSDDSGKFVSGSLHWSNQTQNIVSFDVSKEIYSEISQPCCYEDRKGGLNPMLGVLTGCLSLLYNFDQNQADIWVMKEYGKVESWSKLFSIQSLHEQHACLRYSAPLFISRKNEVILLLGSQLVLYNIDSNSIVHPFIHNSLFGVHTYVESLVSPYLEDE